MTEDEMVGWYHRLSGHEFEQAPGVGEGQGSLACCSPWGHKESDTTESRSLAILYLKGFPHSSVGKESTCNAGDAGSIPGLGKPPEEGIGYPLQYSWASLVTQLVKNPPAMWETWV